MFDRPDDLHVVSVGRSDSEWMAVSIPFSSLTRPTQSKRHLQGRSDTSTDGGNSVGERPGKMISARGKCHPPICSARLLVQALTKQKIPSAPRSGNRVGSPVCCSTTAACSGCSLHHLSQASAHPP